MRRRKSEVGAAQQVLSWSVMAVLAAISLWVLYQQAEPNPAVRVALGQGAIPAPPALTAPADFSPPSLKPLSPPERFTPATLADKINGKAELYLPSGFKALTSQRLALASDSQAWLEAFIYDMGTLAGAFAVYSQQRRPGVKPLALGRFAYASSNALFMVHGRFYVEVIASRPDQALLDAAGEWARRWAAGTQAGGGEIPELALFPAQGLIAGSQAYLAANAFGLAELDRVFVARYSSPSGPITAFISKRATPAEAQAKAAALGRVLGTLGGKDLAVPAGLAGARVMDVLGATEVVMSVGLHLAGVHEAMDRPAALALAERLREALSK